MRRATHRMSNQAQMQHSTPISARCPQFLMYKDEGGGTSVVSMLFDDADEHFRHIIDYAPLPLPP